MCKRLRSSWPTMSRCFAIQPTPRGEGCTLVILRCHVHAAHRAQGALQADAKLAERLAKERAGDTGVDAPRVCARTTTKGSPRQRCRCRADGTNTFLRRTAVGQVPTTKNAGLVEDGTVTAARDFVSTTMSSLGEQREGMKQLGVAGASARKRTQERAETWVSTGRRRRRVGSTVAFKYTPLSHS